MTEPPGPPGHRAPGAPSDGQGLGTVVASAVRWSAVEQGGRFAVMVVLTRLVAPEDFGLAAIAFVLSHLAPLLGDLGLGAALVHRPELRDRHISTAFTTGILAGGLLALTTIVASGPIARFFDEPSLRPLIVVISATFILRGAMATPRDLLRRELHLRPVVLASSTGVAVSGALAIAAALQGAGAWALVLYVVGENLVSLVMVWWTALTRGVWRPRLGLARTELLQLLRFGAPVSLHQVLYYGQSHLDDVLVGRFLGAQALGFYGLAYRLMLFPIVKVADVVHGMVFPAFASIHTDRERFRSAFLRSLQAVSLVCIPASIGIAVVAPVLVPEVFGERWAPAATTVQVLALNGPRLVLTRLSGAAFQGSGLPMTELRITGVSFVLTLVGIVAGLPFGIVGVAVGYTVAGHLVLPFVVVSLSRALGTPGSGLAKPILPVLVGTTAMAAIAGVVLELAEPLGGWARLLLASLAGSAAYVALLWTIARDVVEHNAAALTRGRG